MKTNLLSLFFIAFVLNVKAQIYNHPTTTQTYSGVSSGSTYYDNGGSAANYGSNINSSATFISPNNATSSEKFRFSFSQFNTEASFDSLSIYDGPTVSAPFKGKYSGTQTVFDVYSTKGEITFHFVSNNATVNAGWTASISTLKTDYTSGPSTVFKGTTISAMTFTGTNTNYTGSASVRLTGPQIINGGSTTIVSATQINTSGFPIPCSAIPGTYNIEVIDPIMGTFIIPNAITIVEISAIISKVDVSCNGLANGSVNTSVSGGTPPYSYSWSNGSVNNAINSLSPGNYSVNITDANNCSKSFSTTINEPSPLVASPTQINVTCNGGSDGSATISSSGGTSPYTFSWSNGSTNSSITNLSAGTYTCTVKDLNLCQVGQSFSITQPSALNGGSISPTNTTICAGASASFTNSISPSGGSGAFTYAWEKSTDGGASWTAISGATTLNYTDPAPLNSAQYRRKAVNTCGTTYSSSAILTVNPAPTLSGANNVCIGSTATLIGSGSPHPSTPWSSSNVSIATINSAGVLTGIAAGTSTITYTNASGCSANQVITVNPNPTVNAVSSQTICFENTFAAVNFTGSSGATFNWTNNTTAIGLGSSGVGNIPSFTGTNSGNTTLTSTVTVTPILNGCSGTPKTFDLTVYPNPTVSGYSTQTYCNNTAVSATTLFSNVAASTIYWSNSNTAIGLGANGTGNVPAYTATNTLENDITATISTYAVANGCTGPTAPYTTTVKGTPIVNAISNQTICLGNTFSAVNFTGTSGATYSWLNSDATIGLTSSGVGNIAPFNGTNATNNPLTSTVTVTPVLNSCMGTSKTFNFIVNPQVNITSGLANQYFCNGNTTSLSNYTSNVVGATYTWSNSNTAIGLAANGTGNLPSFTASNVLQINDTANITVYASANGCNSGDNTYAIIVKGTPVVDIVANQLLCNSEGVQAINFTGTSGATFNWINDNTNVGVPSSGSGNIAGYTAPNTGALTEVGNFTVTPLLNGCTGFPQNFSITLKPLPVASGTSNYQFCAGQSANINLFTSNLAGTNFAWANNNTSIGLAASGSGNIPTFTTINTGSSLVTANIDVTPTANGCTGSTLSFLIDVAPAPTVSAGADANVCESNSSFTLNGAFASAASSVTWTTSGSGTFTPDANTLNADYVFSTADINAGSVTLTLTANPLGTCSAVSDDVVLTIDKMPSTANAGPDQTICTDTVITMAASSPSVFTSAGWSVASGPGGNANDYTNPSSGFTGLLKGTTSVFVWGVSNGICPTSYDSVSITIIDGPVISLNNDTTICSAQSLTLNCANNSANLNWSTLENTSSIVVNPNVTTTYTVTADKNGCTVTDSVLVTVSSPMNVNLLAIDDTITCFGSNNGAIAMDVTGGTLPYFLYQWNTGQNSLNLANVGPGNYQLTVTDALGCTATSSTYTIYEPSPMSISVSSSNDISCLNPTSVITAIANGGTGVNTYSWSTGELTDSIIVNTAGVYDAYATDENGCVISKNAIVNQTSSIGYSHTVSDEYCNGKDGSITVTPFGGSGTINILWEDGQTSTSVNSLSSGVYTFTLSDTAGCTLTDSIVVGKQGLINVNVTALIDANPLNDGYVYLYQTQDTGAYLLVDTMLLSGNNTVTFSNVNPAYKYIVGVLANNSIYPNAILTFNGDDYRWALSPALIGMCLGPDLSTTINVINPIPNTGGAVISGQVIDASDTTGSRRPGEPIRGIDIILEDVPGGNFSMRTQTDSNGVYTFEDVPAKTYTIYVNMPGCDMVSTYTLTVDSTSQVFEKNFYADSLGGTIDTTTTVVEALCNYNLQYAVTAGCAGSPVNFENQSTNLPLSNFNFYWDFNNDGNLDDNTKGDNQTIISEAGSYVAQIKIESVNGVCKDSIQLNYNVEAVPQVNAGNSIEVCVNGSAQLSLVTNADNYSWSDASLFSNPSAPNSAIITSAAVNSQLVVTAYNLSGCVSFDTLTIIVNPLPQVSLVLNYDTVCYGGGVVFLGGESPTGGVFTGTGLTGNLYDPVVAGVGTHAISYTVMDANNCISSVSDVLEVAICAGIETKLNDLVKIYPNPSSGLVYFTNNINENSLIELIDITGKSIFKQMVPGGKTISLNVENQPKGLYFVRSLINDEIQVQKLIIE